MKKKPIAPNVMKTYKPKAGSLAPNTVKTYKPIGKIAGPARRSAANSRGLNRSQ